MNEVTTAQMKELERLADAAGLPYPRMMENAGAAAARELMARVPGLKAAAVFCGRGNNGGLQAATGLWRRAACKTPVWR